MKIDSARVMLTNYRKKNCDKILASVSEIMSLSDWLKKNSVRIFYTSCFSCVAKKENKTTYSVLSYAS